MNTPRAASLLIRVAAISLATVGMVGRDTSAKVPRMMQAPLSIPVPNMRAYWAVDGDTGGMATDRSGNGNHGTYNGATIGTIVQPVPAGNASSFQFVQASNQYISVPDSPSISVTGSFTLAAWVRTTLDSTLQQGIIEKYDAPSNGYSLRIGGNEHFGFSVWNGSTQKNITTAGTAVPFRGADINQWNHVAGVYQQGVVPNMQIFKNGTPDATTSANAGQEPVLPPTDGTSNLQIGKDYGSNAFQGNIDEVRIYNRALNATEIGILMNGQPAPTGLVATGGNSQVGLSWTAPVGSAVPPTYAVIRGTSTGVYTTLVTSGLTGTTYSDPTVTPGIPYFYAVVAVTVMASANSNEGVATANNTPPPPPPPPPAPRTSKVGGEDNPCGCGTASPASGGLAALGLLVVLMTMAPGLFRRG